MQLIKSSKTLHTLFTIVCIGWVTSLTFAQTSTPSEWKKYVSEDKSSVHPTGTFIMLEIEDINLLDKGTDIVRILDRQHVIAVVGSTSHRHKTYSINNQWKLAPNLKEKLPAESNKSLFVKSLHINVLKDQLGTEAQVLDQTTLITAYSPDVVRSLLGNDQVYYLGLESTSPAAEARVIDLNLHPNHINTVHAYFNEINGSGIVASVKEQAFDINDIDLAGRAELSPVAAETVTSHATEMATIIGGKGNSYVTGRGVATGVSLSSSDFSSVLPDSPQLYQNLNISVQNHSYGTDIENFYGAQAQSFDESSIENPTLLHVFSSGNQGNQPGQGTYEGVNGFANLTGNYKQAKNILVVGAVDTTGHTIELVSNGPAYDGRIKPELVAYSVGGSSNSAALVSGTVALLQQAYLRSQGSLPTSELVKAIMINTASDVGSKGIDFTTGFGNLDAYNAIRDLNNEQYYNASITANQEVTFELNIPNNIAEMKITLAWTDPPAEPNSNLALINNLDMAVTAPDNTQYLPWILNTAPNSLAQPAVRGVDQLNNVEQVSITNPVSGTYTIQITSAGLATSEQSFALAYSLKEKNMFEWLSPTLADNMPYNGETPGYFRWSSTLSSTTGELAYSVDGGATWSTIETHTDLAKGYYRWQPPSELYTTAIARMTVGGEEYLTDQFTISRPLNLDVAFNCLDSLALTWGDINSATAFSINTLSDGAMQLVETTADTSLVIDKSESRYFSVQPYIGDKALIQSYTIDYALKGTSCFLDAFFASRTTDNDIVLTTTLSSLYGVSEVVFYRWHMNDFKEIGRVTPSQPEVSFTDPSPTEGFNRYFADIRFANGAVITSNEASIFYFSDTPFSVFPNPIVNGDELSIFSKPYDSESIVVMELINLTGQVLRRETVNSDRHFMYIEGTLPGIYLYRILVNDEAVVSGRLMIAEE